jgi:hypothetical protein
MYEFLEIFILPINLQDSNGSMTRMFFLFRSNGQQRSHHTSNNTAFWDVVACSPVECFRETQCLHQREAKQHLSNLKMEAVHSSESINLNQARQHLILGAVFFIVTSIRTSDPTHVLKSNQPCQC